MDTDEDTAVTIDVLASDSDVDGDALTVSSVTQPANGSAVNNGTDVTYTPDADYCGSDGFGYAASDGSPAATRQRHRVDGPTNGDLAGAGANLTYTHHASYTTTERFV